MSSNAKETYQKLCGVSKTTSILSSIYGILEWDQEAYMPEGAIGIRSLQLETLSSIVHKQKTSPKFYKLLGKLIDIETGEILTDQLDDAEYAALREWRRDYIQASKLPNSFVKLFSKTTSNAVHVWATAKKRNAFKDFAPHLEKIVHLCRKKADILGFKEHPYDALLDLYEPEMTASYLTHLFGKLRISLTSLLKSILTKPHPDQSFLKGEFPVQKQWHFSRQLLHALGFDESTSRLDQSTHPFCSGIHPSDTRMTTRIFSNNPFSSIFSVIHEAGHGLYNQGLPAEHFGTPLCEAVSLGIDESQSRFWETRIGKSYAFWQHFYPLLQREFPEALSQVYLEDFYAVINHVKPSLIRVDSDEVTYTLHILLRFELEKALMDGSLKVKEIPEIWNAKMQEYLGIIPDSDMDGCLQDIHWSMGSIGYFPTYTLGNLYAAQFFTAFEKAHSNWKEKVASGELAFIREWLHQSIHRYGKQFRAKELIIHVTGKPLSEEPYIHYLEQKYKSLYRLS